MMTGDLRSAAPVKATGTAEQVTFRLEVRPGAEHSLEAVSVRLTAEAWSVGAACADETTGSNRYG